MKEFIDESFEEVQKTLQKSTAATLYFYSEDCNVCLALRPKIFELLKAHFPQIEQFSVNSQKRLDISSHLFVFNVPMLITFFEGKEFKRYGRHLCLNTLEKEISRPYQMLFS